MKFLHTMIRVNDIERSLNFYQELIGLSLSRTKELSDATLYFLSDGYGSSELELTYNHELPEGGYKHGNYLGHLAFQVEDMDKFTEQLKAFGMDYDVAPFMLKAVGSQIAFINDPDGISIEIIEKK